MSVVVKDFGVINQAANESFQRFFQAKKNFTHLVGSKNGNLVAYFFVYYDFSEPIDLHNKTRCIKNLISEYDIDNLWGKVVSFEVKEAVPWQNYNMQCVFLFKIC